ncbi:ferrous iron transporter B [Rhodopirellula sp. JC740]|uniref:Ferrous iron transporter B n=1 Tax=Rhodopirellula halodulae TaxID=2894198 RepID=A0ABS8NED7_9BACT|nr:ferrous iron transporter B [Rhodopirellula sp. JC740]MCC9641203.1 ferrous iron transporter B [Rhodopirellula sp. JC740]
MSISSAADTDETNDAKDLPACQARVVAMVGNPNVGKTSLFNRLTNLLAKTSNFAGTTVDRRTGSADLDEGQTCTLVDLPGMYSLTASSPEEQVARSFITGESESPPEAVLVVVDATNLQRSLAVAREAIQCGRPTLVAVNMVELARKSGTTVDLEVLQNKLGCPVVGVSARTGEGVTELKAQLRDLLQPRKLVVLGAEAAAGSVDCDACGTCPFADGHRWASTLASESTGSRFVASEEWTDRVDKLTTHRFLGPIVFAAVMIAAFASVFYLAAYPMDWLDASFGWLIETVGGLLPAGDFNSLVTDGILAGIGGVVIFLPQICILFFMLAILEDSGYLSRAVVVIDQWMRRVGLPGQAFVPLLAAHACAIPAIMSTKVISNRRDRLAAIMVIPLMTCSARLPVYTMVAALLFPSSPWLAALLFASAYALGMLAAFVVAWMLKRSILPGEAAPLILDLPPYRTPSLSNAIRHAYERGWMFLRDAGTVILVISIVIWVLSTYPRLSDETFTEQIQTAGLSAETLDDAELENRRSLAAQEYAVIGRMGKFVQPVFEPLGFDWKISVGVMTSFAAREVVVSTLSILYGLGPEPEDESSLHDRLLSATDASGNPVFTTATCVSLLVFFVLAMQCLPTQAVTKKETGSWGWAIFQFGYMTVLAYVAALIAYQAVSRIT